MLTICLQTDGHEGMAWPGGPVPVQCYLSCQFSGL